MLRSKYSFRKLFEDFKNTYPSVREDVVYWRPHSFSTIELWFANGDKATYNDYDRKLHFLEDKWKLSEQERREADKRNGDEEESYGYRRTRRERRHDEMEWRKRTFSMNLVEKMKLAGMSQKQLAEELIMSKQAVNDYVHGKRLPSRPVIEDIADILGVDSSELIDW